MDDEGDIIYDWCRSYHLWDVEWSKGEPLTKEGLENMTKDNP